MTSKYTSKPHHYLIEGKQTVVCEISRDEYVYIMRLVNGGNNFNPETCTAMIAALEDIEADYLNLVSVSEEKGLPGALVITGNKHIFSSGIDMAVFFTKDKQDIAFKLYQDLLYKLFSFKLPTIAAINGHAYAGGWAFASACDYRVMRSDRGFICMSEVDMPSALSPAICSVIKSKFNNTQALKVMFQEGKKFNAEEALKLNFVDQVAEGDQVFLSAVKWAHQISTKLIKSTDVFSYLRMELYRDAVASLKVYSLGYLIHQLSPKL